MRRRNFLGGLVALVLNAQAQAQEQVSLSVKGVAFQGYPLFVSWNENASKPLVELAGKRYPMISVDKGWRAVVPVSIDASGKLLLRIISNETELAQRTLKVKPRNYGMQYLYINPTTLAGYNNPQNRADDEAILAAMKEVNEGQLWQGNWQLPCKARESTGFGQRRLYNGWKKGWHKGLDLAGYEGQAVTAPAWGRVIHRATGIINGNTLVLSHGLGVFSVYFHLDGFNAHLNQSVRSGQQIATVGGTGGFSPHLHWEVRCFGVPVHPKAFFNLPTDWQ